MLLDYARYVAAEGNEKAPLEKIADYLIHKAEIAVKAGIVGLHRVSGSRNVRANQNSRPSGVSNQKAILSTNVCELDERENSESICCVLCGKKHSITNCREFAREPMRERW